MADAPMPALLWTSFASDREGPMLQQAASRSYDAPPPAVGHGPTSLDTGWRHIHLSAAQVERGEHGYLKDSFYALFLAARCPEETGLFMGSLNGHGADFYVTPEMARYAHDLVRYYDGETCSRPQVTALTPVIGSGPGDPRGHRRIHPLASLRRIARRLAGTLWSSLTGPALFSTTRSPTTRGT